MTNLDVLNSIACLADILSKEAMHEKQENIDGLIDALSILKDELK